jgi:YHS domain-containing protein
MNDYQTDEQGVAIGGFDPVSCVEGAPAKGIEAHSTEWQGATWRFANADHLSRFRIEPKRFAPRLGGYCALAAQFGKRAHSNPKVFLVRDGKLYFFASPIVRRLWHWFGNAQKCEQSWKKLGTGMG